MLRIDQDAQVVVVGIQLGDAVMIGIEEGLEILYGLDDERRNAVVVETYVAEMAEADTLPVAVMPPLFTTPPAPMWIGPSRCRKGCPGRRYSRRSR